MSRADEAARIIGQHSYGTWRPQRAWKRPPFIVKADGARFYDENGTSYIDFCSQLMCSNLGHGNRAVIEALKQQLDELPFVAPSFACEAKARAVESLLEVMPEGVNQFFFSTSGTEANEAALKIIRQYQAPQRKYKIISRYRSYHGSTAGSMSLTGDHRRWFSEPTNALAGVVFAPDAYCYRCPFSLTYPACGLQCAEYLDYMIREEGNVAAVLMEPVVGTNGIIVPPDGYFERVRAICDDHGVLLAVDEVMSGWFRTGEWFAINNWGVIPDIIMTAKGCSGAYTPVAVTATRTSIKDFFEEQFFSHGHTYAMHPLAVAAIPAAIAEYKRIVDTGLPRRVSEHLESRLNELMQRHPSIGDVRGLGHFWAVELVRDRETKEPFNTKADKAGLKPLMADKLSAELLRKGVHVANWYSHFIVAPPLTITEREVDEAVDAFDQVLPEADRQVRT